MNGFLQGGGSEPSERSGSGGDVFETVSLQDGLQEDAIGRSSLSRLGEDITHRNGNSGGNVGGLTINFEELFHSFGGILHNEVGSLVLYTLLQSSPIFAKSLAVRSGNDLENLVLPLLRTLYVSSSSSHHISGRTTMSRSKGTEVQVMERPFRSPSQLYVILILLLIFSQDASFPTDSFRRSNIPHVVWFKERQLKNISLGSLLVLSLLRCITFNLNRMQDPFLLSNCCAVLLNLSPNIANLHSYASMRLVSVLLATMKRYTVLVMKNGGRVAGEEDVTSLLGMYSEACRILLQVVKHAVRRKIVDRNLHLVYALVYHRRDLNTIVKAKSTPFRPVDTEKIRTVIAKADELIQGASARRADESMKVLEQNVHVLKGTHASSSRGTRSRLNSESSHSEGGSGASVASLDSTISDSTMNGMEDFKFTYEEEGDPETFFVPYIWDVIVSTVTSNTLEWDRMNIEVFPIMHHVEMTMEMGGIAGSGTVNDDETVVNSKSGFATDIGDVV
uniref:Dymeclin n=2 Tax=Chaetoceros debilis TaxID=122233 RepID=A0A7S3QAK0_9STRA